MTVAQTQFPALNKKLFIIVIIFGLAWGSFLGVVSDRIDNPRSIIRGRSCCNNCKKQIKFYDLIPIVSFIVLKGRCRYCKKKIDFTNLLIELLTALVLLLVFWHFGLTYLSIILILSISILELAVFSDIKNHEVEFILFCVGIPLAIFWFFLSNGFSISELGYLGLAVVSGAILPAIFSIFSSQKWMGYGDIFFAVWIASFVGYPAILPALFASFFIGSLFGIIQILAGRARMKTAIPFGPFLALGGLFGLFFGDAVFTAYLRILGF